MLSAGDIAPPSLHQNIRPVIPSLVQLLQLPLNYIYLMHLFDAIIPCGVILHILTTLWAGNFLLNLP